MSFFACPLLVINLGCEMIFILNQRLHAQNIESSRQKKVLRDIFNAFTQNSFMNSFVKSKEILSPSDAKIIFTKLAHTSFIELNECRSDFDLRSDDFEKYVGQS